MLRLRDLRVSVGAFDAVRGLSLSVRAGERVGLVGESGSGKSLTALAIMQLLPPGLTNLGEVWYDDRNLITLGDRAMSRIRGKDLTMIFQDPLSALNPTRRVGDQLSDLARRHDGLTRTAATARSLELLEHLGLPRPGSIARSYPHQLSGGQRQRVMIGLAVICRPRLIIADEPTTALDTTLQRRILDLLARVVSETGSALILITHDLPVVAHLCERIAVMYAGRIVEEGSTAEVLASPRHPYTSGLLNAQIRPSDLQPGRVARLPHIRGSVPILSAMPDGCAFAPRCDLHTGQCDKPPALVGDAHRVACWHPIVERRPIG